MFCTVRRGFAILLRGVASSFPASQIYISYSIVGRIMAEYISLNLLIDGSHVGVISRDIALNAAFLLRAAFVMCAFQLSFESIQTSRTLSDYRGLKHDFRFVRCWPDRYLGLFFVK